MTDDDPESGAARAGWAVQLRGPCHHRRHRGAEKRYRTLGTFRLPRRRTRRMTLSDFRSWLATLAEAHATIPAEQALKRLPLVADGAGGDDLAALDVEAAGKALGRSSSTIRDYCRSGLLEGAYKQRGKQWKVPRPAIAAFHRREFEDAEAAAKTTCNGKGTTDLSAWRKEIDAA